MIPRAEAQTERERRVTKQAAELEELLDTAIRLDNGTGQIWISVEGKASAAIDIVKRKYERGGWKVTVSHDQRDGSTMVPA